MSSAISEKIHPLINYFYSAFREGFPKQGGTLLGYDNVKEKVQTQENFTLRGSYYICESSPINIDVKERIFLGGYSDSPNQAVPGASLLAGRVVNLKAPNIEIWGTVEHPVVIVGLDKVTISGRKAGIKNLTICLFKESGREPELLLDCTSFSDCENIRVITAKLENNNFVFTNWLHWKTHEDVMAFEKAVLDAGKASIETKT